MTGNSRYVRRSWSRFVSIVGYRLDDPRFDSRQGQDSFLFSKTYRTEPRDSGYWEGSDLGTRSTTHFQLAPKLMSAALSLRFLYVFSLGRFFNFFTFICYITGRKYIYNPSSKKVLIVLYVSCVKAIGLNLLTLLL